MTANVSRYDISPFVQISRHTTQELQDPGYKKVEAKYTAALQAKINQPNIGQLFRNKAIAALFLDKVPKLLGTYHPDAKFVERFGYSSSTIMSMEIIRYLSEIRNDPRLARETQQFLDDWISREQDYLGIAIIFDGWRSGSVDVMQGLEKGNVSTGVQITAPEDEVKQVAAAIGHRLAHLAPGEKYKVLGGYNVHETRCLFKKEQDGTFTLYHFDTGALNESAEKYMGIPADIVSNPLFWEEFIKDKLSQVDILKMLERFKKIGKRDYSASEEQRLSKSLQLNNTCPAHAVEAELRYEMVLLGRTPEEGLIQYKLIKSMMAEKAVHEEKGQIDPQLYQILESKERSKHRYLHWWQIVQNPVLFEQLRAAYIDLIHLTEPFTDQIEYLELKLARTSSKVLLLRFLDDFLRMRLGYTTPEKREQIFQKHAQLFKLENSPILCVKEVESTSRVKGAVHEILEINKKNAGGVWRELRSLLHRLPDGLSASFEKNLRADALSKEELVKLLVSYIGQEKASDSIPLIKEMLTQKLITLQDLDRLLDFARSEPLKEELRSLKKSQSKQK